MIHKSQIEKYPGTLSDLAIEIGDLKYDALADFLNFLSIKIQKDGEKDKNRGRVKLASELNECSLKLNQCKHCIDEAWRISEPYMK